MTAPEVRRLVWIKEEGLEVPPAGDALRSRGWSVRVLGFDYERWRKRRFGALVRLAVSFGHAALVALRIIPASLVVGVHYAGVFSALLRAAIPVARHAVVINSLYRIPQAHESSLLSRLVRRAVRSSDAVIVNSDRLADSLVAQRMVASRERVFVLHDPLVPVIATQRSPDRYAFSGGISARDWEGLSKVVRATCAEVRWVIACPDKSAALFSGLDNVVVRSSIPLAQFDALAAGASIVFVPVTGSHVAGVTLVRSAQAAGAVVVAYGGDFLHEYIASGVDGIIARDADEAVPWLLKAWRGEPELAALRARAYARFHADQQTWLEENARLIDFLERVEAGRAEGRCGPH